MHFEQVFSLSLGLYFCVHAAARHHSYHQNAYWLKGRQRHSLESECDPGWQCVAYRDCHGVIKPWYAPKSRCGPDHTLVCCGPTSGPETAVYVTSIHRPELSHVDSPVGSGATSASAHDSECDPGWRCVAYRDCHGAIKPWYAPKSRCGSDHTLVCCGPTPVREVVELKFWRTASAKAARKSPISTSVANKARTRNQTESECDPGWRCVAYGDCRGAIKPGYAPKSRCGPDRYLVCCGPTRGVQALSPGIENTTPNSQQHNEVGSGAMSPSERACDEYSRMSFMVNSIVGGENATMYSMPFMVAIGYRQRGQETSDLLWNCGGAIISDRYVLTAAHCITDATEMALEPTALRAGSAHVPERGPLTPSDRAVTQVTLHPDHRPPSRSHDLALLRADPPLKFSASVRPACLPSPAHTGTVEKEHAELWAAGWGATNRHGTRKSTQLKKTKLSALSLDTCKEKYASSSTIPTELDENIICAADLTQKSGTCSGDSGGPLVSIPDTRGVRGAVVVGVTSFGGVPCADVQPSVFTRTTPALRWIEGEVWPSS